MYRKTSITIAILLSILMLNTVFGTAFEIGNKKDDNKNEIKPIGDHEINITYPREGWLHIIGIPVIPLGKTLIIGHVVNIIGYATNINNLECIVKDVKTGEIVYRESNTYFGTGQFKFTWNEIKKGDYCITVWEGTGFAPSAEDTINVKVL